MILKIEIQLQDIKDMPQEGVYEKLRDCFVYDEIKKIILKTDKISLSAEVTQ